MLKRRISLLVLSVITVITAYSQPTHVITGQERDFKRAKEHFIKEEYAFAYPLFKELKKQFPDNTASDHAYLNDDISYYYIVCELKLMHPTGKEDALLYLQATNNEPRRELMSFHLA